MKNKTIIKNIKKAKERMDNFSARDSKCPICKASFRKGCEHSVTQAKDRLYENYIRAVCLRNEK